MRNYSMKLPKELTTVTKTSKALALILFISLPILAFFAGARYQHIVDMPTQQNSVDNNSITIQTHVNSPTHNPTPNSINKITASEQVQVNGVEIEKIKYILPPGWKVEHSSNNILFTADGGGYLSVKKVGDQVDPFSSSISRRTYYCKVSGYCTKETTFTPVTIGNISGYRTSKIDNSGGGDEYFGAKGTSFYIISTFNASSTYANSYQQILNSLIF